MKSVLSTLASPRLSRATPRLTGGLALLVLALAGCNCGPTRQSCVLTTDCPSGQVCSGGACYPGVQTSDAGPTATGGGGGTGTGGTTGAGAGTGQGGGGGGVTLTPCVGLQCQQNTCEATHTGCAVSACQGGARTSISGVVREPAGQLPLYNVLVYVPNSTVQPFAPRGRVRGVWRQRLGQPAGHRADRRPGALHPQRRAVGRRRAAGHPDRPVAATGEDPRGGGVREHGHHRPQPHAAAAQQDGGRSAADGHRHRRLGRLRVPALEDGHRRQRVHQAHGHRARALLHGERAGPGVAGAGGLDADHHRGDAGQVRRGVPALRGRTRRARAPRA